MLPPRPTLGRALFVAISGLAIGGPPAALAAPEPVADEVREARAPAAQIEAVDSLATRGPGARIYRFQQEVGGIAVRGSAAIIQGGDEGALLIADTTRPGIDEPPPASIGRGEALAIAQEAVGAGALRGRPRARPLIDPDQGDALVWDALIPSGEPLGDFHVVIDAASGEVLSVQDVLMRATGQARIFTPNPVVTQGSYTGLTDNGDANSSRLTNLRRQVTLGRMANGQTCLTGRWVVATNRAAAVCASGRDFGAEKRASDRFEAIMAYYHVDTTQNYISGPNGLSLADAPNSDFRQPVRTNNFPDDNSFYSPSTFRIEMGRGGVDDAEDGDVINHEYGHSLQDDAVLRSSGFHYGGSLPARAMGEGYGDYIAAMMTPASAPLARKVCVAEWDSTSYAPLPSCLRRTDDTSTLAGQTSSCGGATSYHCVGQVWSSALWKLRGQLGEDADGFNIVDTLALSYNQLLANPDPSWSEAATAVIAADRRFYCNVPNGGGDGICGDDAGEAGQHEAALMAEFQARGFI